MESNRKKRKVHKVVSATQEPPKSPKPDNTEALIKFNGELVEQLFSSTPWKEIAFPLLEESVAGVSGRFTNGRFYHGTLTQNWKDDNTVFVAGYQKALMDFYNHLDDFVKAKNKLIQEKKEKEAEAKGQIYNPFLEDDNDD